MSRDDLAPGHASAAAAAAPGAAARTAGPPLDHAITTRLKLRHLRLIVALDDHRKLNRAARELSLTQPAASKMLGEIERALGVPLFERLPRGIEPTRYGEALIRRTRTMLSELAQAGEEIAALRSETGGAASVGALMSPAADLLVGAIAAARARLGRLQVSVDVDTSDALIARLAAGKLDFAIARIPGGVDPTPFDYEEIGTETVCMMVRRGHPLARAGVVRPADLADREWVMQPRGSLIRHSVEAMLARHGLPAPTRVLNSGSTLMVLAMIAGTEAIAPVGRPVADLFRRAGDFEVLKLAEPIVVEPFGLVQVRGRALSPAARILLNLVRDHRKAQTSVGA